MSVKVSILIPTYNRADYLCEAIKSALAQTWADIEVIVLDDASPDETPQAVQPFLADPRLRYVRHPQNLGIANNWKAGIGLAGGAFFCLLHDDDTFEPTFVETLLRPLQEDSSLILAFCDHWVMDGEQNRLIEASDSASERFQRRSLPEGHLDNWAAAALLQSSVPVGATLFRRSLVSPDYINESAKGAIDGWLFYQCARTGHGAYYSPQRLMNYRLHAGSMSRTAHLYMLEGHIYRHTHILEDARMTALHQETRKQLASVLVTYARQLLVEGRPQEARQALRQSLNLRNHYRTALVYGLACSGPLGTKLAGFTQRGGAVT